MNTSETLRLISKTFIFITISLLAANAKVLAFAGGNGSRESPYQISTSDDLEDVNNDLSAHYILINDINLTNNCYDYAVIAPHFFSDSEQFTGSFDGNGYNISNLEINAIFPFESYAGLFGQIGSGGSVRNIGIIDCSISGSSKVGGLCGGNSGIISGSYATGSIAGSSMFVGGLCGLNDYGTIVCCYSTGTVTGSSNYVGGLCGNNDHGTIISSYSMSQVSGDERVGGLCGNAYYSTITTSYSTGTTTGNKYTGGFCGYSYVSTINSSFWDTETSTTATGVGYGSTDGVVGETTAQMKTLATFINAGWDFISEEDNGIHDFWHINDNDYPKPFCFSNDYQPADLEGNGTQDSPFLIFDKYDLVAINHDTTANYLLMDNLDLTNTIFNATAVIFSLDGKFDGNGFTISNLSITGNSNNIGFFGIISKLGTVSNLSVIDCEISGRYVTGGICSYNYGTISSSCITGAVLGTSFYTGGLAGINDSGTIKLSCSSGSITSNGMYLGGLVGENANGEIFASYSSGQVTGNSSTVGGLVGYNSSGTIESSYSSCSVSGATNYIGGLCGRNAGTLTKSYATGTVTGTDRIGGVCGWNTGTISSSFWDTQTSAMMIGIGYGTMTGTTGKITAEMQTQETFISAGWDFVDEDVNGQMYVWYMLENDYPLLYWQAGKGDINYDGQLNVNDLKVFAFQWLSLSQEGMRIVSDINIDRVVDLNDYVEIAEQWQVQ